MSAVDTATAQLAEGAIQSVNPVVTVPFHYAPAQFLRQGGVGGWEQIPHPRRPTTVEWRGTPPHTLDLEVVFDAIRRRRGDVERELSALHLMARGRGGREPSPVRLLWGHGQQLQWVITDLVYGPEVRSPANPTRRLQQWLTISLVEYRVALAVISPAEQAQENQNADAGTPGATSSDRTYTVRAGDTLSSIAASQLGSAARWPEIAELNGLRDPNYITPGQVLRLPAA